MTVIELLLSGLMIQNILYLFRTLHCVYLHKYMIYLAQNNAVPLFHEESLFVNELMHSLVEQYK